MDLTPILSLIQDSDITCKKLTCRSFNVVDAGGTIRIEAFIHPNGLATMRLLDMNGKIRINTVTLADGKANMILYDKDGKERINAYTLANGQAGVQWNDKDEIMRINAETTADGTVYLPTSKIGYHSGVPDEDIPF